MDKLAVVDIQTVANIFGVSERQVRTWVSECGLPSTKDGRTRSFNWPDVLDWYVGFRSAREIGVTGDFVPDPADDLDDEKESYKTAVLRKTRAEADLKQMALAKLRGEMIGIADAKAVVSRTFGTLRSQLLNMAPKVSTRLAGESDPVKQEAIIREEMEVLCRELATGKIVGGGDEEQPETASVDLEAAAAPQIEGADWFLSMVDECVAAFLEAYAPVQS